MDILPDLVSQAPGIAAVIFVVVLFVRYLEKRDASLQDVIALLTKEMKALTVLLSTHARETTDGIAEMHRTVHRLYDEQDQEEP